MIRDDFVADGNIPKRIADGDEFVPFAAAAAVVVAAAGNVERRRTVSG